jgi:hypothetical protein
VTGDSTGASGDSGSGADSGTVVTVVTGDSSESGDSSDSGTVVTGLTTFTFTFISTCASTATSMSVA